MADASYNPKIYKTQGGAELVVTSSGTLTLEGRVDMASGSSMTVASGAGIGLASGSSFSCATDLEIASGGNLVVNSGGGFKLPVQTVSSSAATITAQGISLVAGTTVGPTYLIANPVTGSLKFIHLTLASSAATNRAIIAPASTGVSFASSGQNQLTLASSALKNVCLVGISTAAYRVFGVHTSTMGGLGNVTT